MNHRDKLRLARRMMTPLERKLHTAPFQSSYWEDHKFYVRKRIEDTIAKQAYCKKLRLERMKDAQV